jgi:hypothetical protein
VCAPPQTVGNGSGGVGDGQGCKWQADEDGMGGVTCTCHNQRGRPTWQLQLQHAVLASAGWIDRWVRRLCPVQIGRGLSRPKNTLPLLTSTVKLDGDDPAMRFCFRWGPGWGGGRW